MRATTSEIRALLDTLAASAADAIESETLECKPWDQDARRWKEQIREIREIRELRETVVCLANAKGGTIVLGIQDRVRSREAAIAGVGDLRADALRKAIYDGTDPHLLVDVEELVMPEGRLLVLHVPRGLGVHTTTEGVAKIRVGKECQPLTGSMLAQRLSAGADIDRTAQVLAGSSVDDLDPASIEQLRQLLATEGQKSELARLSPRDLLAGLGLLRDGEL